MKILPFITRGMQIFGALPKEDRQEIESCQKRPGDKITLALALPILMVQAFGFWLGMAIMLAILFIGWICNIIEIAVLVDKLYGIPDEPPKEGSKTSVARSLSHDARSLDHHAR